MQTNNILDLRRVGLLLKEEFSLQYLRYLMGLGVVFGGLFIIWWINGLGEIFQEKEQLEEFHYIWFGIILLGGGAFFTSLAYVHFGAKTSRLFYLNLPASNLEKYLTKWIITAVIYPLSIWLIYLAFSWLANKINIQYTEGRPFAPLPAFGETTWLFIRMYWVTQTVFLAGAVFFHRYAIFKTAFSIMLVEVFLMLFVYICARIIFPEMFDGWTAPEPPNRVYQITDTFKDFVDNRLEQILEYVFWLALAPIMLVIGFFKLTEKEV